MGLNPGYILKSFQLYKNFEPIVETIELAQNSYCIPAVLMPITNIKWFLIYSGYEFNNSEFLNLYSFNENSLLSGAK